MSQNEKDKYRELRLMITESLSGAISPEDLAVLEDTLRNDPDSRRYYVEYLVAHAGLRSLFTGAHSDASPQAAGIDFHENELWQALAENEKEAPGIPIAEPLEEAEEFKWAQPVQVERRLSRFSIFSLALSAAAMLAIALMVLVSPVTPTVAVLTDSVDAEWISPDGTPVKGGVLSQGELTLTKGFAEITFDDGAVVVVQAPSVLTLESPQSMFVERGRISAFVSEYATGFTVNTPSGSIIDLGTEFGVSVAKDGSCSVQVYKGKANLIAGRKGQRKTSQILNANEARSVDAASGRIRNIRFDHTAHVHELPSPYERAIQQARPVAYWRASEYQPDGLANVVQSHIAVPQVRGQFTLDNGPHFGEGRFGKAVHLAGDEQYFLIGNLDMLNQGFNGYTISLWVKPDPIEASDVLGPEKRYYIFAGQGRYGHLVLREDGCFEHGFCMGGFVPTAERPYEMTRVQHDPHPVESGKWYHVVISVDFNRRTKRMFVNGREVCEPVETMSAGAGATGCRELYIGSVFEKGTGFRRTENEVTFKGSVSDISVFDYPMGIGQISRLYTVTQE